MDFIRRSIRRLSRDHVRLIVLGDELQERTVDGPILILRPLPEQTADRRKGRQKKTNVKYKFYIKAQYSS